MLTSILTLIVDTIASVLGGVLLLRFWMQVVRVRPPTTLGQFIFQLTDWLVRPLRRLLPGVGGYDWASLIGAILIIVLSIAINLAIASRFAPEFLVVLSLLRFFEWIFYGFIGLLIIEAIFSWVNPHAPLAPFIRALNDPLLRPLRRIVPLVGNIDLSPLVALILLQIAMMVTRAVITSLL
ncbi:YggT family protein [Noviherbaspirillum sp. CPCC 100848]|uniref:YggT family protein n=2 Tax=Pseudomonadota TaxID=1224 RepID=A0ABU6J7G2_9BURK|nr:YggT family protein [Noviherbaspirillum sp. CPCC 100848]MEC4719232.1 YggT family protein [Noviherbaspirillum sp. CPCC 100848]